MGAGGSVRSQSSTPAVRVSRRKLLAVSSTPVVPSNTKKLKIKGKKLEKMKKMKDRIFDGGELAPILEATEDSDSEPSKLDLQDEWYHPCYVPPA